MKKRTLRRCLAEEISEGELRKATAGSAAGCGDYTPTYNSSGQEND
jgi:hypothetical protein